MIRGAFLWFFLPALKDANAFSPQSGRVVTVVVNSSNDPNPSFPAHYYTNSPQEQSAPKEEENEEAQGQANTRFSAFAPDQNLEAGDFRAQLKENMKADLERRRKEDPNRGNQPAKSYLDSL